MCKRSDQKDETEEVPQNIGLLTTDMQVSGKADAPFTYTCMQV